MVYFQNNKQTIILGNLLVIRALPLNHIRKNEQSIFLGNPLHPPPPKNPLIIYVKSRIHGWDAVKDTFGDQIHAFFTHISKVCIFHGWSNFKIIWCPFLSRIRRRKSTWKPDTKGYPLIIVQNFPIFQKYAQTSSIIEVSFKSSTKHMTKSQLTSQGLKKTRFFSGIQTCIFSTTILGEHTKSMLKTGGFKNEK